MYMFRSRSKDRRSRSRDRRSRSKERRSRSRDRRSRSRGRRSKSRDRKSRSRDRRSRSRGRKSRSSSKNSEVEGPLHRQSGDTSVSPSLADDDKTSDIRKKQVWPCHVSIIITGFYRIFATVRVDVLVVLYNSLL